ncbi:MAG: long-chain-fatty-acid--CoA ligase [Deltaproteobacteria bacterium]|nr:long-chain-fatty-acid--CoA ligase [Deltaproteobacteria bacterium]
MNIWKLFQDAATSFPNDVAVVDDEHRVTYAKTFERTCSLARYLRSKGIRPGDRVSILEDNSYTYFEVYFAAAGLGVILNPLNNRLAAREIAAILLDAGARWLIAGERFAKLVSDVLSRKTPIEGVLYTGEKYEQVVGFCSETFEPAQVKEEDVAHLYYTSGTTGKPKGVMLTHKNVCLHAQAAIEEFELSVSDVWGHIAPMFHLADAWATFAITRVGGRHVMVRRFDPEGVLQVLEKERITISNLIPTMLNQMNKHERVAEFDFPDLRVLLSGGASIAPEVVKSTMETFGCDYIQTYGMTETSPYLTVSILEEHLKRLPPDEQFSFKAKTGRPFKSVDLKVVDEQGVEVAPDGEQVGEIWVKGETVTPGYWNNPKETQAAFQAGWLCTGDLAVLDQEGYVNIVDRKKDLIVTGGENVYSIEVENILYMHPAILEAAVFGVPDETWGEAVRAAVVLNPGQVAAEEEIIGFCRENLAAYKAPKRVDFFEELPKTGSGKIFKKKLRDDCRRR